MTSRKLAERTNRFEHNIVQLINDHKEYLEKINKLKERKLRNTSNKSVSVFTLTNKHLIYIAGVTRDKNLKCLILDLVKEPVSKKSFWERIGYNLLG